MPSSLASGLLNRYLRIARRLTIVRGGALNIQSVSSLPTAPKQYDIIMYNNKLRFWNGTAWEVITSA
jgi:hypothetical protein